MPPVVRLASVNDLAEWRAAARGLLCAGIPPEAVAWAEPGVASELFAGTEPLPPPLVERKVGTVPARFLTLAELAICHRDPERFDLLYRLLWRLQKDRRIFLNRDDPDVGKLHRRVQAVAAEGRRMRDTLRFRRAVAGDSHKGLAAWFEPSHYVLERIAPHFVRAVTHEDWIIATPYRTAFWDGRVLTYGAGRSGSVLPVRNRSGR
ncbi:MAG TPA: DUF4130 domain-containing protein [Alphaproteobacteria bacterium]|nr:DUF4130 domain-containing protein [Alphaproteobacteria bacterium]